jgi:hypothetical protein
VIALFASSYGTVFAGAFALAALVAGTTLASVWDHLADAIRHRHAGPGRHRR